jgi:amidase
VDCTERSLFEMSTPLQPPPYSFPNDPLGAFCKDNHIALPGAKRGPLVGLTFGAKDLFHVAGSRTGFGQPDWLRTHEPATETAEAVRRLLDAGATLVGKTITDELAYSLTGENFHYGMPVNIHDARRTSGGSSSGSASAVAGGLVDFSLGSDCGGSIRLPASYCGILGIRPSHGRVSLQGAISFAHSFDVAGWFARDAVLFERLGAVLLDEKDAVRIKPRRLVLAKDAFLNIDEGVRKLLLPVAGSLGRFFENVSETTLSSDGLPQWCEVFRILQAFEIWQNHGEWITRTQPRFGPGIKERLEWASSVTPAEARQAEDRRAQIRRRMDQVLDDGVVLCLPTSPRVAPLKDTPVTTMEIEYRHQAMCLLCIAGLNGLPQINLPIASSEGLPIGISLVGARGTDEELLALAHAIMNEAGSAPS